MKFNKLHENIFKPASDEEVKTRKEQANLEIYKDWVESWLNIKYEDLLKLENINKKDNNGYTPLIFASYKGYLDIVKILLEAGADVNIKDINGDTALIDASRYNNIEIVKLLLNSGADVNAKNKNGNTALIIATMNCHKEIIELLKQYVAKE